MDQQTLTSQFVAAEDLREGDYITVTRVTWELIPMLPDEGWRREIEAVRVDVTPAAAGCPLKVIGICVPFVLVKSPYGKHATLDLRRTRVAKLPVEYGKKAYKRLKADAAPKVTCA